MHDGTTGFYGVVGGTRVGIGNRNVRPITLFLCATLAPSQYSPVFFFRHFPATFSSVTIIMYSHFTPAVPYYSNFTPTNSSMIGSMYSLYIQLQITFEFQFSRQLLLSFFFFFFSLHRSFSGLPFNPKSKVHNYIYPSSSSRMLCLYFIVV